MQIEGRDAVFGVQYLCKFSNAMVCRNCTLFHLESYHNKMASQASQKEQKKKFYEERIFCLPFSTGAVTYEFS